MSTTKKNIVKIFGLIILLMMIGIGLLIESLPSVTEIKSFQPESTVYNLDHFDWNKKNSAPVKKYVPLHQISPELRTAVIISEDDTFFGHSGINIAELKKAFQENLEKKRYARGASTITMQLARNIFLIKQKTLIRKFKEMYLAKRIEKVWSKRQIFEYYLNIAEWGDNIYGAEAAAWFYFNKPASHLDLAEASLLAGILPNPIVLNPFNNLEGAKKRQLRVLKLMRNARLISDDEYKSLISQEIYLRGSKPLDVEYDETPEISIFENALKDPRIPEQLKRDADSTGIIFLPEEK
jgi:membrane peptidoglycan carboxypeptidase